MHMRIEWGLCTLHHGIQISMEAILAATQRDPQNDWTATQNRVNYDHVFTQAPYHCHWHCFATEYMFFFFF